VDDTKDVARKLDEVIALLEDTIIFQAMQSGVSGGAVRKFLGVDMNRVTHVSKMLKAAKRNQS
jgi:hypothetical protein